MGCYPFVKGVKCMRIPKAHCRNFDEDVNLCVDIHETDSDVRGLTASDVSTKTKNETDLMSIPWCLRCEGTRGLRVTNTDGINMSVRIKVTDEAKGEACTHLPLYTLATKDSALDSMYPHV